MEINLNLNKVANPNEYYSSDSYYLGESKSNLSTEDNEIINDLSELLNKSSDSPNKKSRINSLKIDLTESKTMRHKLKAEIYDLEKRISKGEKIPLDELNQLKRFLKEIEVQIEMLELMLKEEEENRELQEMLLNKHQREENQEE